MGRTCFYLALVLHLLFNSSDAFAKSDNKKSSYTADHLYIRIRWGEGGFYDSRSDIDKLGGGQLALDLAPVSFPVIFSISNESYTNSPEPSHVYEISDLVLFNIFYLIPYWRGGNTNIFLGGGGGILFVPEHEGETEKYEKGLLFHLAAGINAELIWNIGLFGVFKYIHSKGYLEENSVINFNEFVFLLGISLNFEW